ncbi:hypothetical protein SAMN05216571_1222 [Onishia taeanensis]|uniref:Uncharacterized protein n=1 Tax=Onishia taeanensis TaxID=284577 RepID=A0A1G7VF93_9GAMM|nr:hypothetical protein [Halomonas taeanensis]SDG58485.1 hypothetical protein SAMN05216571_1222 [Halomonas taeanensis]
MKDIRPRIEKIEELLDEGSISSLTYAALECRFTIELICYERLRIAYGDTSYSDLRKWQPKDVVQQVIQEANELAATPLKLSVSNTPIDPDNPPQSVGDYENFEYIEVGTQTGLDIKKIGRLWNSLSGAALHVQIPKSKADDLSVYGNPESIKKKVEKALHLFRQVAKGNLLTSSPGPEVSCECHGCGAKIKRKVGLVYDGMVASCSSESCQESYLLKISEQGIEFGRRQISFPCDGCGTTVDIPAKLVESLRMDQSLTAECGQCAHKALIRLRPCKVNRNNET